MSNPGADRGDRLKATAPKVDPIGAMPETLLLLSKALFAVAGCGAGVRLAQIARREGGVPLHAWASAMVFAGGIGLLGFAIGPALAGSSPELARAVMLASDGLERLVLGALAVFLWRVFGSGSAARSALLCTALVLLAANWAHELRGVRWPDPTPPLLRIENQLVLAVPFTWSAIEAGLAYARSRRQLALGLTDALTSNRFLLWSAACGCFASIDLAAAAAALVPSGGEVFSGLVVLQALLFVATAAIVALAFFPPGAYLRRLGGTPAH